MKMLITHDLEGKQLEVMAAPWRRPDLGFFVFRVFNNFCCIIPL
jgi:hypothetical protein